MRPLPEKQSSVRRSFRGGSLFSWGWFHLGAFCCCYFKSSHLFFVVRGGHALPAFQEDTGSPSSRQPQSREERDLQISLQPPSPILNTEHSCGNFHKPKWLKAKKQLPLIFRGKNVSVPRSNKSPFGFFGYLRTHLTNGCMKRSGTRDSQTAQCSGGSGARG